MNPAIDTEVLIVGAGPVGLTLAMDFASRGIDVTIVGASPRGGAAERQVQSVVSPLDGDLPPPRRRRKAARSRACRRTIRTTSPPAPRPPGSSSPASVSPRGPSATRAIEGPNTVVADSGASAPDQSDLSRAHTVRACCGPTTHPHAQPHGRSKISRRTAMASPPSRDLDNGERSAIRAQLPDRLRRRQLDRAQDDRREACRHPGHAARAIDLHPRAAAREPTAGQAPPGCTSRSIRVAAAPRSRSTGTRRGSCTITCTATSPSSIRSIATGPSARSSASDPISIRGDHRRRTGSAVVSSPTAFAIGTSSSAAMPRICGCLMRGYGMNAGIADAANLSWMIAATFAG